MKGCTAVFVVILWFLLCPIMVDSMGFHLVPNTRKCLREQIHKHTLVAGEYEILPAAGQTVDLTVVDSKGGFLANKENAEKGRFTFTTDEADTYEICFQSKVTKAKSPSILMLTAHVPRVPQEIYLKIKHGSEAKNYQENTAEKLVPLDLELRRLEDIARELYMKSMVSNYLVADMRSTNESTNSRLLIFSVCTLLSLIGMAVGQVIYLRRYFKSKKLVD